MNKKGFVLLESILIATLIITMLTACYYPFVYINNRYNIQKKYQTIEDVYLLNNIRNYIYRFGNANKLIQNII